MMKWQQDRLQKQTPHPKEKGKASNGTVLDNPEKAAAWQTRWNKDYAHRWEERGGKLYPRQKNA